MHYMPETIKLAREVDQVYSRLVMTNRIQWLVIAILCVAQVW